MGALGVAPSGPLEGFALFPHLSFSSVGTGLPSPVFFLPFGGQDRQLLFLGQFQRYHFKD